MVVLRARHGVNSIWSIPHQIDQFKLNYNYKFINSNSIFTYYFLPTIFYHE